MDQSMIIKKNIQDALSLKQQLLTNEELHKQIEAISDLVVKCYQQGGKVLFCGNGGSAADSQHLAAELSGRYYYDRPPLSAEALHVNTSYLTAVANDYSYDEVYARLVKAVGKPGDVIFGLSTSGNSQNVLNAFTVANEIGFTSIAMTGEGGGKMKDAADFLVAIPSKDTPRIQECHMLIGHTICQLVEQTLFPND